MPVTAAVIVVDDAAMTAAQLSGTSHQHCFRQFPQGEKEDTTVQPSQWEEAKLSLK